MFGKFDRAADPEELNELFDIAGAQQMAGVAVFPSIRGEADLVEQLAKLASRPRWTVTTASVSGLSTDDLLIGMQWSTAASLISTPMGFGPLPTMPVTRRAPYVCIATWPGGHENPHRKKPALGRVDFLDSHLDASRVSKPAYDKVWASSVERTTQLLTETADNASWYRNVTFRLSSACRSLWAQPEPTA